jgi:hypothetical protein
MSVPNLKHIVARVRKTYPAKMTKAQVGEAVYRIASEAQAEGHDVGVLLKDSGHRVPSPVGEISSDILVDIPDQQEYDIFSNADGGDKKKPQAGPVWSKLESKVGGAHSGASMNDVRRPVVAQPVPSPTPQPEPEEPSKPEQPDSDVIKALAAMTLRADERHEAVMTVLARLEDANRKPRKVSIGRWSGDGQVFGIEG